MAKTQRRQVRKAHEAVVDRLNRHMRTFTTLAPDVWRTVDSLRQDKTWPDWCFLPSKMLSPPANLSSADQLHFPIARDLAAWRATQGIYAFDATVIDSLWRTPVTGSLPVELLRQMPEWCCYVPFIPARDRLEGVFITLDILDYFSDAPEEALVLVLDFGDHLVPVNILLSAGGTLAEAIARSKRYTDETAYIVRSLHGQSGNLDPFGIEIGREIHRSCVETFAEPLVATALYLCSTTSEFRSSDGGEEQPAYPTPVRTRKTGLRLFPPDAPRFWEVSYRLGAALRGAEVEQSVGDADASGGGRARPRPHIRRAHWHSYRTGPRERPEEQRLVVRWLPPLPVAFAEDGGIVPTVRPVQERGGR